MQFEVNSFARNAANLKMIRVEDPEACSIIAEASHVEIYKFDPLGKKWTRYGVAGSAFILERDANPKYRFMVINKQGVKHFVLDVDKINKSKLESPYIMLRCSTDGAPVILGLWQHDDEERKTLFKAIQDVMSGNSNPAMNSTLISATTSHSQPMPPRNPANANVPLKINITPSKAINASVNKTARERNGEEFLTDREISARNAERATKTNEILKSNSNVEKKSASSKSTPVSIPVSMLFNASGSKNGTENDTPKAAGIEKHDHMSELLLSPSDITGTIRKFKKSAN